LLVPEDFKQIESLYLQHNSLLLLIVQSLMDVTTWLVYLLLQLIE